MEKVFKQLHPPSGPVVRELSKKEIEDGAKDGDVVCMRAMFRDEIDKATTDSEKLEAIIKFLGNKY